MKMRIVLLLLAGWFLALSAFGKARPWPELDSAVWTQTASTIDPEAAWEVLVQDVKIDAGSYGFTSYEFFRRIRVYDARAIEDLAKIELPISDHGRIDRLEARTLKPDGTILELDAKDIFEREAVKVKGYRQKVKSFAPPGLEAGVILEFRYARREDGSNAFFPLIYQEGVPVRSCHYAIKMPQMGGYIRTFNVRCPGFDGKADRSGFLHFNLENLPAAKDESVAPPEINTRTATLIYLSRDDRAEPVKYWRKQSEELFKETRDETKPNRAIRSVAEGLVAAKDTPIEKLVKLHDYCRREILNLSRKTPEAVLARKDVDPSSSSVALTLKHKVGWSSEINRLFVAMARALDFDARLAAASDRDELLFNPSITEPFMIPDLVGAVQLDGAWVMTDPGATFLPFGVLRWNNSDTPACIGDKDDTILVTTMGSPPEMSRRVRKGTFKLEKDGTLEGDVTEDFFGQWLFLRKRAYEDDTPEERAENVQDLLRDTLKGAVITKVEFEGVDDAVAPLKLSYHLKVPDYAERTGSRLFVSPAVFQRGDKPLFSAKERENDIMFDFRYLEVDEVGIEYPEGFEFEAPAAPPGVDFGNLAQYESRLSVNPLKRLITLQRFFALKAINVEQKHYEVVKAVYEALQNSDNHTLTLRRKKAVKRPAALNKTESDDSRSPADAGGETSDAGAAETEAAPTQK